jgi:hypothetical protein
LKNRTFLAIPFLLIALTACQTELSKPTSSNSEPTHITNTEQGVIPKTKAEVKAGAAVIDKLFINRSAQTKNTELLDQYSINFSGVFRNINDYISLFNNECKSLGGDYLNYTCWSSDKQRIHFVAEIYITEYRDTFNYIFINVIAPKDPTPMTSFADALAPLVKDMPAIKFKPRDITRFELMQKLTQEYDDISEQLTVLDGFDVVSKTERLAAAKTIHDSVVSSLKTKKVQAWHTADDVFGSVFLLDKYQSGTEICADVKIFRKVGIKPSFSRDINNILKGDTGEDTNKNTLCTLGTDTNNLSWRFVS